MRANRPPCGTTGRVLVVDDHRQARESVADVLRRAGHQVTCCSSAAEALQMIPRETFDCIVTDLMMPGMNGLELIIHLEQRRYGAQVVMVTAHASVATAVEAMRHGAFDYLEKPFDVDRLEQLVSQAIQRHRLPNPAQPLGNETAGFVPPVMVGTSPAMQALRARIALVAPTPETVLITGESGTGKELVARAIHATSGRQFHDLVTVNCAALSDHLMESELFGHERGAFTGAETQRQGRFELAEGGSILLDEISEIDLRLQAKLLRVLQEKSFERVGSSKTINVDARLLASTNRDLPAEVAAGKFRQDLFFRLAVVPLVVPPLRERREDVPELIEHFLQQSAELLARDPVVLDASAYDLLTGYDWPGNVRELENLVKRISVLNTGGRATADELRRWFLPTVPASARPTSAGVPVGLSLEEMERRLIEATLERFEGHREKTAKALGIGVRTLSGKLRQYGYAPRAKAVSKAA
jgi:DNA-binding NtrC family response regulator